MKALLILLFATSFAHAQLKFPYTNDSNRVYPLLANFIVEAEKRGVNVIPRLSTLDTILITTNEKNEYRWSGDVETIELEENSFDYEWLVERRFTHEIGHHLGLDHCEHCSISFMGAIIWGGQWKEYMKKERRDEFYDHYFEALRDPAKHNEFHKHF